MIVKKIFFALIIILLLFVLFSNDVHAFSIEDIFKDAKTMMYSGKPVNKVIDKEALKDTSDFIYRLLLAIGIIVAVAVGVVLGIQFMVASADDKAKIKESLIAYTISCVVLFGAYGIWSITVHMAQDVTGTPTECPHEYVMLPSSLFSKATCYCKYCGADHNSEFTVDEKYHECSICHTKGEHIWSHGFLSTTISCDICEYEKN